MPFPSCERRLDRHGIADAVTWTGWLPRAEVRQQLRTATVGVSPDSDDPYSRLCTMIKVSEYLAAGLPAIVADLPENRVTAGAAACYFRPGDAADLAARLEDVLFDADRRRELADAAARRAPALLWDRSATRLLAAYHHLLDGTPARRGRPTRRRRARRDRKLTRTRWTTPRSRSWTFPACTHRSAPTSTRPTTA